MTITAGIVFSIFTAYAQSWTMDKAHSRLVFNVTHLMVSDVEGKIKNFDVTVSTPNDDFTGAVVDLTADVSSINTDNDYRDKDLKGAGFFDVAKFPTLSFKSTSFTKVDSKNFKLKGNLTIHGITKPVELAVEYGGTVTDPYGRVKSGFEINGKINRQDFGLIWGGKTEAGDVMIGDDVKLHINVQMIKG